MRKFLSIAAIAAMCLSSFTACSDDDENNAPTPTPVPYTDGVFLVNAGNSYSQIYGSLTYIGSDGSVTQNIFAQVNGRSLGDTPNDVMVYGDKLYVVATGSNTVEVINKSTYASIAQINTTALMGEDKGKQPRRLAANGGNVYVSTFDGYVAAIDTANFSLANIYQVGSYPEGMAVRGQEVYVTNSDYGMGMNPSISIINTATGEVTETKNDLIKNPTSIVATSDALYVLDYGSYDESWNQTGAGVYKISGGNVTKVADATLMAVDTQRGLIYTVNAPYTYPATPVTYGVYNMASGATTQFVSGEDIDSPAAITVDLVNGDVYIASYKMDPDTGYADYSGNGYVNQYTADGAFVKSYEAGVGPTAFAFNYGTTVNP